MHHSRLLLALTLLLAGCSFHIIPTGPVPSAVSPGSGAAAAPTGGQQAMASPTPAPATGGPLTLANGTVVEVKLNGKAMAIANSYSPTNYGYAKRWDFGNTTVAGTGIKADGEVGVSWQITIYSTGQTEDYHTLALYFKGDRVLSVRGYLSKPNDERLPGVLTYSVTDKKLDFTYTGKLMDGSTVTNDEVVVSIKGLPDF